MLPSDFLERIKHQSYIDVQSLTEALQNPASVSVRVNPQKWDGREIAYEHVPWEANGYYLDFRPLYTLDPLFHAGVYYPQEAAGMFTGEVFRQVTQGLSGLRILDLCGAPGGKSTHLSTLIADNGFLVANEVIRSRAAVLAENITKWGTGNTIVTQNDPSDFASLEGFFDIILTDAPCSGEGMFNDTTALTEWSLTNTQLCSERQRRIVMDVWPALKPGGILIYSTCTFNPAENEENILWFSKETGADSVIIDISAFPGIIEIKHKKVTGYGFHPGRIKGDGFFISALRKQGEAVEKTIRAKSVNRGLNKKAALQFADIVEFNEENIIFPENKIIALALKFELFSYLSERLRVIKSGTMIGEMKNNDFIPAHDLAMSVKRKPGSWPVYGACYDEAIAFLRHDEIKPSNVPEGRVLFCYRNVALGFMNNLGRRINNGYPQNWRIRMQKKDIFEPVL